MSVTLLEWSSQLGRTEVLTGIERPGLLFFIPLWGLKVAL